MGVQAPRSTRPTGEPGFGTGLLQRTVAHLMDGHDVVVINPLGGGPVLDLLAIALRARRCRVLRVTGAVGGGLETLAAEVAGDSAIGTGSATPDAFRLLTTPGPDADRIVLLAAQAHRLGEAEYRFLDRAAKAGPLQFVLVAPSDPLTHLVGDLVPLHNRIAAFHPLVIEPGSPLAVVVPSGPPHARASARAMEPDGSQAAAVAPSAPPVAGPPLARPPRTGIRRAKVRFTARAGVVAAVVIAAMAAAAGAGLLRNADPAPERPQIAFHAEPDPQVVVR